MRWINHKMVTASMVYSLTGGVLATAVAMSSSHLPDLLEFRGVIPHRTITHWIYLWLLYVLICLAGLFIFKNSLWYLLYYVGIGCLCHIFQDFLSISGVPLKHFNSKSTGLGVYKTNGEGELTTALGLTVIFIASSFLQGRFSAEHLYKEIEAVKLFFKLLLI